VAARAVLNVCLGPRRRRHRHSRPAVAPVSLGRRHGPPCGIRRSGDTGGGLARVVGHPYAVGSSQLAPSP